MLLTFVQVGVTSFLLAVGFLLGYLFAKVNKEDIIKEKTIIDHNKGLDEDDRKANPFYD